MQKQRRYTKEVFEAGTEIKTPTPWRQKAVRHKDATGTERQAARFLTWCYTELSGGWASSQGWQPDTSARRTAEARVSGRWTPRHKKRRAVNGEWRSFKP
jgi:hypothetical protein